MMSAERRKHTNILLGAGTAVVAGGIVAAGYFGNHNSPSNSAAADAAANAKPGCQSILLADVTLNSADKQTVLNGTLPADLVTRLGNITANRLVVAVPTSVTEAEKQEDIQVIDDLERLIPHSNDGHVNYDYAPGMQADELGIQVFHETGANCITPAPSNPSA